MAKQTINNGEKGLVVRNKLNQNFTELYDSVNGLAVDVSYLEETIIPALEIEIASKANSSSLGTLASKNSVDYNSTEVINKPTIPSTLSQLTDDSTHRVVTDTEKNSWNNKSNFSGSYTDLSNKPSIPAAQVNSDWNSTSGVSQILNKPAIPDAQVKSDWNASGTVAEILNKPSIPAKLSDLSDDTTHRTVTDNEKSTWSGKSDFSGSYTDLSNKPSIPDSLSDLSEDTTHRTVTDTEKSVWNNKSNFIAQFTQYVDFDFGDGLEKDYVDVLLTIGIIGTNTWEASFRTFNYYPVDTPEITINDFTVNQVSVCIKSLSDYGQMTLRASTPTGATGVYRVKVSLTIN